MISERIIGLVQRHIPSLHRFVQGLPAERGTRESSFAIRVIGYTMVAIWCLTFIVIRISWGILDAPPELAKSLEGVLAGSGEGFLPLRIIAYSVVHLSLEQLTFALLLFTILIRFASDFITVREFVRLYSLGVVLPGLVFTAVVEYLGKEEMYISGGAWPSLTCLVALAVLHPRVPLVSEGRPERVLVTLLCLYLATILMSVVSQPVLLRLWQFYVWEGCFLIIVWVAATHRGIGAVIALWYARFLVLWGLIFFMNATSVASAVPYFLAEFACLISGLAYGCIARLARRRGWGA